MTQPKHRGTCQVCGFRWGLQRDGLMRQHWVWAGLEGKICKGSHNPPVEALRLIGASVKAG